MKPPNGLNLLRLDQPGVCVVVCTRNRPTMLADTIRSLLVSDHPAFEVLVVDQSTDDESERLIRSMGENPRLRYLKTCTVGLSTARNVGFGATDAQTILMTDDDCTVPPTWISEMVRAIDSDPTVACLYCNVQPGPHDTEKGFIPYCTRDQDQSFHRIRDFDPGVGIGAGVGYRREAIMSIGGFDELLGAGARFKAAEELDVALRLLAAGYAVQYSTSTSVVHHGFRTHEEMRYLIRGYVYGTAACLTKLVRCGHLSALAPFAKWVWNSVGSVIIECSRRGEVPPVLGRMEFILRGIGGGALTPVDRRTARFRATTRFSRCQRFRSN